MTDCPRGELRDLLPDLMHERLDAAVRADVVRHVAACPACAAELALLRSMRAALEPAPRVDAARIAAAARAARAASPHVRPERARFGPAFDRPTAWRIAAAFAALAVGIAGWTIALRRPARPTVAVVAPVRAHDTAPAAAPPTAVAAATPSVRQPRTAAPDAGTRTVAAAPRRGLVMDGGVGDLPDSDVQELLQSLDSLRAIPDADPTPVSYDIGEGAL